MGTGRLPVSRYMIIGKVCPFRKIKYTVEWKESINKEAVAEDFLACYGEECSMWDGQGCSMCRINMVVNQLANEQQTEQVQKQETETSQTGKTSDSKEKEFEATIKVLEAKETKNPGTVRAWCEIDGRHDAIFAKNGVGEVFVSSIGKKVVIKYRILEKENGSKGIFAVHAKTVNAS